MSASSGSVVWALAVGAAVSFAAGFALLWSSLRRSAPPSEAPCGNCGRIMLPEWSACMFCHAPRGFRRAALEFLSGPRAGQVVSLDADVTTIGSAPGSTLAINDAGVSRKHAGIRKEGPGFELADMGSTNGVYVNGERVARRKLVGGDVIRVGSTEIVFKADPMRTSIMESLR